VIVDHLGRSASRSYDPHGVNAAYNVPLSEPPPGATTTRFEQHDLAEVRRVVAREGLRAGLPEHRVDDLCFAINELATNSVLHGGGAGTLRTWTTGDRVSCEVRDFGRLTDHLAGRLRPAPTSTKGRGLVVVHYLCDLVQTYTSLTGTTVRVRILR
jgi:anti-sigma regulatory factor (Ser/Thr protein kinase)